ncbi:hypothetical protein JZ751_006832 [Albula glossodonta]|uniref:Uncharacterized protein n=1 Tax=Albula glossodonta TaxID=121402 RepID=A0A8T2P5G5_9TELE|nr:hypothetical protein JZ751_006832 [Albula glossodonta]
MGDGRQGRELNRNSVSLKRADAQRCCIAVTFCHMSNSAILHPGNPNVFKGNFTQEILEHCLKVDLRPQSGFLPPEPPHASGVR